jgi:hypothetical protein
MTISSMKNVLSARKQLICSINVNRPSTSTANKLPDWIKPPVVEDGEETPVPKSTENPSFFARIFPRGKGTSIDKHGGAAVDSNLYIPNEKGIAFNPSMPLGELIKATKNMPKFYATEMKVFSSSFFHFIIFLF